MMMATRRWVRQPNRKQTKLNKGSFQCVFFCFVLILLRNVFAWEITSCECCWLLACCAEIKMKYSNDKRIENMPERFHRCTLKLVCVCCVITERRRRGFKSFLLQHTRVVVTSSLLTYRTYTKSLVYCGRNHFACGDLLMYFLFGLWILFPSRPYAAIYHANLMCLIHKMVAQSLIRLSRVYNVLAKYVLKSYIWYAWKAVNKRWLKFHKRVKNKNKLSIHSLQWEFYFLQDKNVCKLHNWLNYEYWTFAIIPFLSKSSTVAGLLK